jgi:hypothetical protein
VAEVPGSRVRPAHPRVERVHEGRGRPRASSSAAKGRPRTAGPVIPRVEKITVGELLDGLKAEYEANGRRSLDRLTFSLAHLRPVFGARRAVM